MVLLLEALMAFDNKIYFQLSQEHDFSQIYLTQISNQDPKTTINNTQQLIYFISANIVIDNDPNKSAVIKILSMLLNAKILLDSSTASNSLYQLLPLLIDQYSALKTKEVIDSLAKFKEIVDYIQSYKSTELSYSSSVDTFLLGLLKIAHKLLSVNSCFENFEPDESILLIDKIFFGCLFPNEKGEYHCKSEATREIAYKIVISLAKYNLNVWIDLLETKILPIGDKVTELDTWATSPNIYERSNLGYIGLKNLGCICYINSMLQQFFMISPFRNAISTVCDGIPPQLTKEGIDDNLLHQFQRVFIYLLHSNRRDYNPAAFCYSFKESDGKPTNTAIQHDAHEFLNILFERLEKMFKDTPYRRVMQHVFGGKSCSQITCSNCGYVSSTYEDYYTLSLEIKNQRNLDDSLERFVAASTVSDYKCSNCEKRVDVSKRTLISTLPNVLVVHLQRFTYNFDTFMNEKIHSRLEFPTNLDMSKYTEEGYDTFIEEKEQRKISKLSYDNNEPIAQRKVLETEEQEKKEKQEEEKDKENRDEKFKHKELKQKKQLKEKDYYKYKLVGVVMHNGNAEAGHYYSYIDTNRDQGEEDSKNNWVEFNDSAILSFNFDKLEEECFGGSMEEISTGYMYDNTEVERLIGGRSKSAYMLIYEKTKKGMLPLRVDSNTIKETDIVLNSLECDSTAISRAENSGSRIYGKDSDELYLFYKYNTIPISIPPNIIEVVI